MDHDRRIDLILKARESGLTASEREESRRLREECHWRMAHVDPRPTEDLDAIDARLSRIKSRIEAKRKGSAS